MKNWKRMTAAIIVGIMTASLAACGSSGNTNSGANTSAESTESAAQTSDDTTEYKTLRIGCGDTTEQALLDLAKVAQKNGYLEEELNKVGYTYEVTGFAGQGPEINAALMSDSLDATTYGNLPVLTATGSGASVTVVAAVDPISTYAILAADDSIQEPADLEGKTVVVQQGTILYYFWEKFVEATGIDGDSIEIINSNAVDALSLVQTGDADAFVSAAYSVAYYEEQGIGHMLGGYDFLTGTVTTVFAVNNSVLEESPEVGVAINKALIRSYNEITENPESFYELLGEQYGVDAIKTAYGFDETLSYLTPELTDDFVTSFQDLYDWMQTNQLLNSEFDVDSVLGTEYYQQAVEELEAE